MGSQPRQRLELLYRRYAPMVFRRAQRILASEADAHEVVQDVFLRLFERSAQFEERSALSTYLYSATTNACLNRIARERNRHRLRQSRDSLAPAEVDVRLHQERLYLLHERLARMPGRLASVFLYAYLDELTHEEIAELLGCSRRQVGKLLERAAEWIRFQEEASC